MATARGGNPITGEGKDEKSRAGRILLHKDENPILGKREPTHQEKRSKQEDYARQLLPDGLTLKKAGGANRREFTPPVPEDLFSTLSASQSPRSDKRSQQIDYARQLDNQKLSKLDSVDDRSIYVGEEYQAYPQGPPPSVIRGTKQRQQQEYAQQIREHAELQSEPSRKESYAALLETTSDGLPITKGRGPTTVHGHRTYKEADSSRVLNLDDNSDVGSPRTARAYKGDIDSARVFGQGIGETSPPRSHRVYQDEEHSGRVLGRGADPKAVSPRSRKGFPEPSRSNRVLGIAEDDDGADAKSRPQSLRVYKAENSYGRVFGDADYATEGNSPRSRKAFKGKNTNRALGLVEDSDAKSPRTHRVYQEKNTNRALGLVEDVDAVSPRVHRVHKEENSHHRVFGSVDHNKLPQSPPRGHRVYKEKDTSRALGLVEDSDAATPRGHRVYTGPNSSRVFNRDSAQDSFDRRQPVTSSETYRSELLNSPRRPPVTAPANAGSLGGSIGDDSLSGLIQRQAMISSRGDDGATGLMLGGMADAADRLARKKELQQKYASEIASSAAAPPIENSRSSNVYRTPQPSLDYKIRGNSSGGGASSLMIR